MADSPAAASTHLAKPIAKYTAGNIVIVVSARIPSECYPATKVLQITGRTGGAAVETVQAVRIMSAAIAA